MAWEVEHDEPAEDEDTCREQRAGVRPADRELRGLAGGGPEERTPLQKYRN